MSDASLEDCQEYLLTRLARSKGQKIAASELRNSLSTAGARAVGLDGEGAVDRTIRHLLDEGYVEEQRRGSGPGTPIHHPRSGSTYRLTGKGGELLESLEQRPSSRYAKPRPTHQSAPLLACQKAFILLQSLRVDDRIMTRSDLGGKLGTKTAKENLGGSWAQIGGTLPTKLPNRLVCKHLRRHIGQPGTNLSP